MSESSFTTMIQGYEVCGVKIDAVVEFGYNRIESFHPQDISYFEMGKTTRFDISSLKIEDQLFIVSSLKLAIERHIRIFDQEAAAYFEDYSHI